MAIIDNDTILFGYIAGISFIVGSFIGMIGCFKIR